ncbi:MAG: hypothetical protein ACREAF_02810, partial [Nitrosopumilaceae archaeon]
MTVFGSIHYLSIFSLTILAAFSLQTVFAESQAQIILLSDKEIVSVGINLTEESIANGNYIVAKEYSKFASDVFARSLQTLRSTDSELADEIHIILVEIQADINSQMPDDQVLQKTSYIKSLLDQIKLDPALAPNVVTQMLSVADEMYQDAISTNNESSYHISRAIILHAQQIFTSATNFDQRQHEELQSFFTELNLLVTNKVGFVQVGTIITAIQRDILGTQTTVNQDNLYDTIRVLYQQLLVEVNTRNYEKAEQLAIEAYLENFEYLEPDIEVVDSALLHKLEIAMREDLRSSIKQRDSPEKIRQDIDAI